MPKIALPALSILLILVVSHILALGVSAPPPTKSPRLTVSAPGPQQYPIMDRIADKIIQKYQSSTCEQLWQEKAQSKNKPRSPEEQSAIAVLQSDPQMRQAFINKIAAPIANKMFECGMIP